MEHIANTIKFNGNKPSKAQIISKVKQLALRGSTFIEVFWGENWLTLDKQSNSSWYGHSWIKEISGESIAAELNKKAEAI